MCLSNSYIIIFFVYNNFVHHQMKKKNGEKRNVSLSLSYCCTLNSYLNTLALTKVTRNKDVYC